MNTAHNGILVGAYWRCNDKMSMINIGNHTKQHAAAHGCNLFLCATNRQHQCVLDRGKRCACYAYCILPLPTSGIANSVNITMNIGAYTIHGGSDVDGDWYMPTRMRNNNAPVTNVATHRWPNPIYDHHMWCDVMWGTVRCGYKHVRLFSTACTMCLNGPCSWSNTPTNSHNERLSGCTAAWSRR